MNFGTPQEMHDEENETNPQTKEEKNSVCLVSFAYVVIVVLIFKYL